MSRNLFQYHPLIGYTFIPGIKARIEHEGGGYLVQANDAGFRCGRQLQAVKPPATYRILVFGDSFTAGDGVSNRDRYSDQLEDLLPQTEVYNFGLSGTGTDQQYLIWREFSSKMDHDLVLIGIHLENIRRCAARYRLGQDISGNFFVHAKPYFIFEPDGQLTLHHVPTPKDIVPPEQFPADQHEFVDWSGQRQRHAWLRKSINRMGPGVKDLVQRWSKYQPLPEYDDPHHPAWLLMKAILRKWSGELTRPAIIFPMPLYQYIEETASPQGVQARFAELADLPNCTIYDPLPDLRSYSPEERRGFRYPHDLHYSPRGHKALAESLAKPIGRLRQHH